MVQFECQQIGAYLTEVETEDENTWLTTTFLPAAAITGTGFFEKHYKKMFLRQCYQIYIKSTMWHWLN